VVGWFGFNAGSLPCRPSAGDQRIRATHFGAATATLGWVLAEWMKNGKPSVLGAISGRRRRLVAITLPPALSNRCRPR